jgi:hypothetical protein
MPQSFRLRSAGARAEEERKNFTDYFSRILASICGICVLSEEKLIYGQGVKMIVQGGRGKRP